MPTRERTNSRLQRQSPRRRDSRWPCWRREQSATTTRRCASSAEGPKTGIVQLNTASTGTSESEGLATAARKHQLPTTTFHKSRLHSGMLMSYGLIQEVYYPRVLMLAERILKGEKPGELPIERPDRFESVINLKTAKALGITIPRSAVARGRGDRMIDSSRCRFFEFGDTPKIQRRKKLAACGIARSRRCSQACPACSGCPCKPAC